MIVKRKMKSRQPVRAKKRPANDWRAAIQRLFAKVSAVHAVFTYEFDDAIHVYSIVERFDDDSCGKIMKQESMLEKAFPDLSFEFHTRAHQGRKPSESGPWSSKLVYLR